MNKHRGTFLLPLGKEEYTVCFSINAMCSLEEVTKLSIGEIFEVFNSDKLTLSFVRALLWSGLQKHHNITIEEAGDLIETYGLDLISKGLTKGFVGAFPAKEDDDTNPQQAEGKQAGGNGLSSSSHG